MRRQNSSRNHQQARKKKDKSIVEKESRKEPVPEIPNSPREELSWRKQFRRKLFSKTFARSLITSRMKANPSMSLESMSFSAERCNHYSSQIRFLKVIIIILTISNNLILFVYSPKEDPYETVFPSNRYHWYLWEVLWLSGVTSYLFFLKAYLKEKLKSERIGSSFSWDHFRVKKLCLELIILFTHPMPFLIGVKTPKLLNDLHFFSTSYEINDFLQVFCITRLLFFLPYLFEKSSWSSESHFRVQ